MNSTDQSFVVCIENSEHPASLEARKIYEVVPDSRAARLHHLRVIDESGEDYLYPEQYFLPIRVSPQIREALRRVS